MKTPLSILNAQGFQNAAQKCLFAAHILQAATRSGGKVVISPAIRANPNATPPVLAVAEVASPANAGVKGWENAIYLNKQSDNIEIIAYLPYETTPALIGESTDVIAGIKEVTVPSLSITTWRDLPASNTPESIESEPPKLEQYFYKYAKQIPGLRINLEYYGNGSIAIPVRAVTINLPATAYDPTSEALQLSKLA